MNTHHIIITGASRGIGQAIALLYASMGWNISICCRHKSPDMEHTKAQITAAGGRYFAFYGDMGNPEDAEAFVTKSVQTFGIPEIFVNNAGISHIGLLQDMTPQQWDDLLHTNLSSVFYTSRIICRKSMAGSSISPPYGAMWVLLQRRPTLLPRAGSML